MLDVFSQFRTVFVIGFENNAIVILLSPLIEKET